MYGIFTYIYHKNQSIHGIGKYTIYGWYGVYKDYSVLSYSDTHILPPWVASHLVPIRECSNMLQPVPALVDDGGPLPVIKDLYITYL